MSPKASSKNQRNRRTSSADGGLSAIGGFIFQFIALPGLIAIAEGFAYRGGSDEQVSALMPLIQDIQTLKPEIGDQDAFMKWLNHTHLKEQIEQGAFLQLKFSVHGAASTIGEDEFNDILESLRRSTGKAQTQGYSIAKWILLTNRRMGPSTQTLVRDQRALWEQLHIRKGRSSSERELIILDNLSTTIWEDALYQYGASFGCGKEEIEQGIAELLGRSLMETNSNRPPNITRTLVAEILTGSSQPRQLTSPALSPLCFEEFNRHRDRELNTNHDLLRRNVLDEISKAFQKRAILVISGHGGSGKSVAVWQWLVGQNQEHPAIPVALRERKDLVGAHDNIIARILSTWSSIPPSSKRLHETIPDALRRLVIANPTQAAPYFILGIDGFDEETMSVPFEALNVLIRTFHDEDRRLRMGSAGEGLGAKLILVCRDSRLLETYLGPSSGFALMRDDYPPEITVRDFEELEMMEFVQTYFRHVAPRFELTRHLQGENTFQTEPLLFSTSRTLSPSSSASPAEAASSVQVKPIDREVFQALHHPVFWHAFATLNTSEQQRLLDGATDMLALLAEEFTVRIVKKALYRKRQILSSEQHIWSAFHQIAMALAPTNLMEYTYEDWRTHTCAEAVFTRFQADALFEEAVSAGLIENQASQWRWTHAFVQIYLEQTSRYPTRRNA